MLPQEFYQFTGYEPLAEEYKQIESLYYEFDGEKKAFCAAWKRLFQHKIKAQQAKKALARKVADADTRFSKILRCDFGSEANLHVHAMANLGEKIRKELYLDDDCLCISVDSQEGGIMHGIQTNLQLWEGLLVLTTYDLHSVEFNRAAGQKVLEYIVQVTDEDYAYAVKHSKHKR